MAQARPEMESDASPGRSVVQGLGGKLQVVARDWPQILILFNHIRAFYNVMGHKNAEKIQTKFHIK